MGCSLLKSDVALHLDRPGEHVQNRTVGVYRPDQLLKPFFRFWAVQENLVFDTSHPGWDLFRQAEQPLEVQVALEFHLDPVELQPHELSIHHVHDLLAGPQGGQHHLDRRWSPVAPAHGRRLIHQDRWEVPNLCLAQEPVNQSGIDAKDSLSHRWSGLQGLNPLFQHCPQ